MPRQHMFLAFEEAAKRGPYDELPMLPPELDIELNLSRNDRPQPFHLICEHDTVLVVMSGEGTVEFRDAPILRHNYVSGDFLYVPAGTPHRIVPAVESIHMRYKLPESALEGVAWFCPSCEAELHRDVWELKEAMAQEGYLRACTEFNADAALRTCKGCGHVHPPLDLAGIRWAEVAGELRAAEKPKGKP